MLERLNSIRTASTTTQQDRPLNTLLALLYIIFPFPHKKRNVPYLPKLCKNCSAIMADCCINKNKSISHTDVEWLCWRCPYICDMTKFERCGGYCGKRSVIEMLPNLKTTWKHIIMKICGNIGISISLYNSSNIT